MRIKHLAFLLPIGLMTLVGCGSGPALLNSPTAGDGMVRAQAVSQKPSISVSRGTLSVRKLNPEGGPVVVGALVVLKNLAIDGVTVVANAVDTKKKVVGTQTMVLGEGNLWRTADPGLALPANYGGKAVSYTLNVVVSTKIAPILKKSLKVGTVSVAKSSGDPNQPPPPPF